MVSYTTQIEIIRGESYEIREAQVEEFIVNKCIKKIDRFHHVTGIESHPKYEAYIYYTLPEHPTLTVSYEQLSNGVFLSPSNGLNFTFTVVSPIYLELLEVSIRYNKTGNFSETDPIVTFPLVYGTNSVLLHESMLDHNTMYYFQPYIKSCIGTTYSDTLAIEYLSYLQDTDLEPIFDTDSNYIFDIYQYNT